MPNRDVAPLSAPLALPYKVCQAALQERKHAEKAGSRLF